MSLNNRIKKLEELIKERAEEKDGWKSNEDNFWTAAGVSEEALKRCSSMEEALDLIEVEWEDEISQKEEEDII